MSTFLPVSRYAIVVYTLVARNWMKTTTMTSTQMLRRPNLFLSKINGNRGNRGPGVRVRAYCVL